MGRHITGERTDVCSVFGENGHLHRIFLGEKIVENNLVDLVKIWLINFKHFLDCLDGHLEWSVVESYNNQVYYLLEY